MLKRLFLAVALLLGLLAAALAVNTARQGSRQVVVPPLAPLAVDRAGAAASLGAAIRARTVSGLGNVEASAAAFEQLHAHLAQRYPRLHAALRRERFGATLVFTWPGSDAAARPIALLAHQDVVPVAPGTDALWQVPPFEGRVDLAASGFVWGRGAWDNKGNLVAQMEAVEALLAAGFAPRRTVYLVLGHDEEVGGREGAARVAEALRQRGVRLEAVLDEGLVVTQGLLPGLAVPAALVGVAEKGALSLRLTVDARPGHSSLPPGPGQSAIGILAAALARLDAQPLPAGVEGVSAQMFAALAPEMPLAQRVPLSNLWLFAPVVERMLARGPSTNALLRTTTALTLVDGGNKENVLPGQARAVVNFRILPGDSAESVTAFVRRVLADDRVRVERFSPAFEPSRVSPADVPFYRAVEASVREVFPGAVVAPGLMLAATDARHFDAVADGVYRFSPVRAGPEDLSRFHGTDERLSVDNLVEMIRFYHRLLQRAAGPATPAAAPAAASPVTSAGTSS